MGETATLMNDLRVLYLLYVVLIHELYLFRRQYILFEQLLRKLKLTLLPGTARRDIMINQVCVALFEARAVP